MRNFKILLLLIASITISGCMKDSKTSQFTDDALSSTINITIAMPAGYNYPVEGMEIKLADPSTGLQFKGVANAAGKAEIKVAPGSYIATSEAKHTAVGGIIYIFNGTSNRIRVTPADAKVVSAALSLNVSKTGQIVVKEFYYGGCLNPLTGKTYANDKYIILYNNSDQVAYLDSLCIGMADPFNAPTSGKSSNWVKSGTTELRDSVPNSSIGWMFPGTGTSNPLAPGEQVVVCTNGINHTLTAPNSVDLSKAGYWALYDPILTRGQSTPQPGVKLMQGYWKVGTATQYIISQLSPALFIYSLGGKTTPQFVLDTYTWNPGYATNRSFDCLMVDKDLVLDGVECYRSVTDSKRLRPEIDNGYIKTNGSGTGETVHRKVDVEATAAAGGRIVYMDSNNSTNDFEVKSKPSLAN
ncbi:MAG: hypothetical protein ACD_77C00073G0004 [uncultured bacterium]|nr:MAG: hypothetical protein ACD_77C00073G0004 [uncultured bacterium]HBY02490.1 hypothetical protein [Rikenellaceae bacterium]